MKHTILFLAMAAAVARRDGEAKLMRAAVPPMVTPAWVDVGRDSPCTQSRPPGMTR